MGASTVTGPFYATGNMQEMPSATFGSVVKDPNQDAGPGASFMGDALLDARLWFPKDKVQGYTGVIQAHYQSPFLISVNAIPSALAANNICAAANVTNGTAMTLASASLGVDVNIPIRPFAGSLNGNAAVTAALTLDFGFAFGNVTSASKTVVVADSTQFFAGMPLVISAVGNAGGTAPLLTFCTGITDATHITINDAPLASGNPVSIGTGDLWGPSPNPFGTGGYPTPTAAYPFVACGPSLLLDSRQTLARGLQIVGVSGGAGGTFTVRGWDIYGMPMSENITVGAGAVTGWGKRAWKYIKSVTPGFTDAHNYTVGTSDVFGFHYRSTAWEASDTAWAATYTTGSTGWTTADTTSPATATTGDVRGTMQTSANGGGSGIGASASNGTVSALAMTGRRLWLAQAIEPYLAIRGFPADPRSIYGVTQFTN